MKNLLFIVFLTLGLFSCQEALISEEGNEATNEVELSPELQDLLGGIQTRESWPKNVGELVEFLNNINFTPDHFESCATEPLEVFYVAETESSLASNPSGYEYSFYEMVDIVDEFWARVAAECNSSGFVIMDVSFDFNVLLGDPNQPMSFVDAVVTICCDPIFGPRDPKGGENGPAESELTEG